MINGQSTEPSVTITHSETHKAQDILSKSIHEGHKTMGVHLEPLGNFVSEQQYLRGKSAKFAVKMSAAVLRKCEAMEVYLRIFWRSLIYSACIPMVTTKQATWIESPAICATLKKIGFSSTTSRAVVFGAKSHGGLGFLTYFCEQGVAKVFMALSHVRDISDTCKLFLVGLSH